MDLISWWRGSTPEPPPRPSKWFRVPLVVVFCIGAALMFSAVTIFGSYWHPNTPLLLAGAGCFVVVTAAGLIGLFVGRDNRY